MRGGSWPNAPVGWPAAATGPLTLRAPPGSGKTRGRGARAPAAPQRWAARSRGLAGTPFPPPASEHWGVGRTRVEGRWRRVLDGAGARRKAAHKDPGECYLRADCGAPGSASPARALGRVEGDEGCFCASSRGAKTPSPGSSWGERLVLGSESAARGAFQSPPASRGSPASLFPADAPPRSLGLRRLVATGAPGTSLRGAGGLAGVVWPAIAARSREAALLETGESLSQLCASSRLSAAGLRSQAAQPAWGKGECRTRLPVCPCIFAQVDAQWQTRLHCPGPSHLHTPQAPSAPRPPPGHAVSASEHPAHSSVAPTLSRARRPAHR